MCFACEAIESRWDGVHYGLAISLHETCWGKRSRESVNDSKRLPELERPQVRDSKRMPEIERCRMMEGERVSETDDRKCELLTHLSPSPCLLPSVLQEAVRAGPQWLERVWNMVFSRGFIAPFLLSIVIVCFSVGGGGCKAVPQSLAAFAKVSAIDQNNRR